MSLLNTKTRKFSDKLKGIYGINVGKHHQQCAEPPYPIIKFANCNIRPIQSCTSVYQMKLCTVSSSLIISRRPFSFIKVSRYSDTIDYLLWNQCGVHLSDKDTNKANRLQFIWPDFYWIFIRCKDIRDHYFSEFFGKLFLWNGANGGLLKLYSNFQHITTIFLL